MHISDPCYIQLIVNMHSALSFGMVVTPSLVDLSVVSKSMMEKIKSNTCTVGALHLVTPPLDLTVEKSRTPRSFP